MALPSPRDVIGQTKHVRGDQNKGETVEVRSNVGRCNAIAGGEVDTYVRTPTYKGARFVEQLQSGRYRFISSPAEYCQPLAWQQEGPEGYSFNIKASGVHSNTKNTPVFTAPLVGLTDAFNFYRHGDTNFFVNSTYISVGWVYHTLTKTQFECVDEHSESLSARCTAEYATVDGAWRSTHLHEKTRGR